MNGKASIDEIRERFDNDVERFSNLETGQTVVRDSVIHMTLVARAACAVTPDIRRILDVGCGAGNYTLKLLQTLGDAGAKVDCDLLDLSKPMLDRATKRVGEVTDGRISIIQSDIRDIDLDEQFYDVIVAAQCLHHLRDDNEWKSTFRNLHRALRPGGSLWISDSISHESSSIQQMVRTDWIAELTEQGGPAHAQKVMTYVDYEDTPRPLKYQLDLMRHVGFDYVDVLHVNLRFASFGGVVKSL